VIEIVGGADGTRTGGKWLIQRGERRTSHHLPRSIPTLNKLSKQHNFRTVQILGTTLCAPNFPSADSANREASTSIVGDAFVKSPA
jgi:hypothetical protein